jgi:3-hydroxyacyl-CoA dehydrogenase
VEVVPAPWTDESVALRAIEILKDVDQAPVHVKKVTKGFNTKCNKSLGSRQFYYQSIAGSVA